MDFGGYFLVTSCSSYAFKSTFARSWAKTLAFGIGIPSPFRVPKLLITRASNFVNIATTGTMEHIKTQYNAAYYIWTHRCPYQRRRRIFLPLLWSVYCHPVEYNTCNSKNHQKSGNRWPHIYHIACSWFRNFVCLERLLINIFTLSSSSTPPASKPQESWKRKPMWLRKTISFSMSWDPRWKR